MAGESPDKVEREKSSGEGTDERVTEPPGNGRDAAHAGEASGADTDGDGEGTEDSADAGTGTDGKAKDERLAAAVAAWVAGPDAEDGADDSRGAEGPESASGTGSPGDAAKEPDTSTASDLPVRPRKAGPSQATAGTVDQPTAMFQVLDERSDRSSSSETDEEEAVRRAENMTAAFFGSSKTATSKKTAEPASGARAPEKDEDAPEAGGPCEPATEKAVDEPTAVFRTRERESAGPSGEADSTERPVDEPTGVFRTRGPKPAMSSVETDTADKPLDEPTAVFRTREPEKGEDGTAGSGESGKASATSGDDKKTDPRDRHRLPEAEKPATAEREPGEAESGKKPEPAKSVAEKPGSEEPAEVRDAEETTVLPAVSGKVTGDGAAKTKPAKSEPKKPAEVREAEETTVIPAISGKGEGDAKSEAEKPERAKPGAAKRGPAKSRAAKPEPVKSGADKPGSEKPSGVREAEETTVLPAISAKDEVDGAESDSERTSQFVPLRSDDGPRVPKKAGPVVPPKPLGESRTGAKLPPPSAGAMPSEAAPQLSEAELTRQQPRPDQAPIDLLAQLTNRPPPEETPLRVAVRRVKVWTPLVLLVAVVFMVVQAVRPLPEPELRLTTSGTYTFAGEKPTVPWPSEGQAVMDVEGLGSFGSSGEEKPVPIASVAKVMTAYVILRDHPVKKGGPGETIPVDQKAEDEAGLSAQNESTVEVKKGDKITQREAVQAIMIASANNVARLLARWDAGSEEAFVKKMNAAAKDLGMKNTKYTDPSGLNASTVSTAADQVKLGKKAMGIDLFRETVRMPGYSDTKGAKHGNWNRLVPLDGVVGIKTGTTTKAGGNLLFAAEKEIGGTRQLIIGAVLGQYRPSILDTVLGESKKLIDAAQDSMTARKVVEKGDVVGYVDDGLDGRTPVVATKDVTAVGWPGLEVELGLNDGGKVIPNEASEGDEVGTLTVGDGPGQVKVPVALAADSAEPGFGAKMTRFF